jgi:hypothetical protein
MAKNKDENAQRNPSLKMKRFYATKKNFQCLRMILSYIMTPVTNHETMPAAGNKLQAPPSYDRFKYMDH